MKTVEPNLSFEWDPKNETLEIHGNSSGLEMLDKYIQNLIANAQTEHAHLMSKKWGGEEL